MTKPTDITGQRFGRLVILGPHPERHNGRLAWRAVCDCGAEKITTRLNLSTGTSSCGCLLLETRRANKGRAPVHGLTGSKVWRAWVGMLDRCSNPKHDFYADYGGRGIAVRERWKSFENFRADMGEPGDGMSLDREDGNGNYEPGNCRWATATTQNRNRRNNILLAFNGEEKCVAEWAEQVGLKYETLRKRIKAGWSPERALTTP